MQIVHGLGVYIVSVKCRAQRAIGHNQQITDVNSAPIAPFALIHIFLQSNIDTVQKCIILIIFFFKFCVYSHTCVCVWCVTVLSTIFWIYTLSSSTLVPGDQTQILRLDQPVSLPTEPLCQPYFNYFHRLVLLLVFVCMYVPTDARSGCQISWTYTTYNMLQILIDSILFRTFCTSFS